MLQFEGLEEGKNPWKSFQKVESQFIRHTSRKLRSKRPGIERSTFWNLLSKDKRQNVNPVSRTETKSDGIQMPKLRVGVNQKKEFGLYLWREQNRR